MNLSGEFKAMSPEGAAPTSHNTSFIMKSIEELDDVIRKRREELDNYRRRQSHGSDTTPISGVFSSYNNTPISHSHNTQSASISRDRDAAVTSWALEESTKKKLELESRLTEVIKDSAYKETLIEQLEREREEYALLAERTVREKEKMRDDLDSLAMDSDNKSEMIHKLESALKVNESKHHQQYLELKRQHEDLQHRFMDREKAHLHYLNLKIEEKQEDDVKNHPKSWNTVLGNVYSRTVNLCLLAALQGIAIVLLLLCIYFWLAEESRYPTQGCITIT